MEFISFTLLGNCNGVIKLRVSQWLGGAYCGRRCQEIFSETDEQAQEKWRADAREDRNGSFSECVSGH